ncbi:hypothetical protein JL721_2553 [Aureococcus anophagefferens]|nr:hypothetical protein JL721_2553 [Aureococcus anophagefferens]
MEDALKPSTRRDVHVERAVDGGANFSWTVTFLTEWPDATDSRLVIDDAGLYSVNSTVRARVGSGLRPDLPGHRFTLSNVTVRSGSAVVRAGGTWNSGSRSQESDRVHAYDWMDIDGGIYQVASVNAQANKITLTEVFSTGPSGAYSAQVGVTVPGSPPPHYDYVEVAPSLLSSSGRYSYPRYTQPRSLAPPRQVPDVPINTHLLVYGGTSLRVLFNHPASDGGSSVTRYRIEWDTSSEFDSFDGSPLGSNTVLVDPTSGSYDDCTLSYCGYTIGSLATGKNYTARLRRERLWVAFGDSADEGGADVTHAKLEWDGVGPAAAAAGGSSSLYSHNEVQRITTASKYRDLEGTFASRRAGDDDWLGDLPQLTVSAVDDDLASNFSTYESLVSASLTGGDTLTTMTGTDASIAADTLVDRYDGFCIQTVYTYAQNATLLGTFALKYDSEDGVVATQYLEAGATAASVKAALEAIGTGELFVGATQAAMGKEYTIVFLERLGPVPPLTFDASRLYGGQNSLYNGVRSTYGLATHSTPASLVPAAPPGPPRSVSAVALSDGSLNVSWTPPVDAGGAAVTKYRVEYDSTAATHEVQRVEFECADGPLVGSFTLTFNGVATGPVPAGASADRVRSALEALATVGEVSVSLASSDDSASYQIAFRTNVGDLPALEASTTALRGSDGGPASSAVYEQVKGGSPPFDEGTVGIYTLPLGSVDVVPSPRSRSSRSARKPRTSTATSTLVTAPRSPARSRGTRRRGDGALDELKTLGPVTVSRATKTHRTTEPLQDPSYVWSVTFDAALGDVPSLLVYAGTGLTQEVIGAHGHLEGSAPFGNVSELVKGGLPEWIAAGGGDLVAGRPYYAASRPTRRDDGLERAAVSYLDRGARVRRAVAARRRQGLRRGPGVARALLGAARGRRRGRVPYLIQYDLDTSFDESTGASRVPLAELAWDDNAGRWAYVLDGLTAGTTYCRVMSYNHAGYSDPEMAASRNDAPLYRVETTQAFRLKVEARERVDSTPAIAAGSTADAVAQAIMDLPDVATGAILVRRWDMSSWTDSTGMGTHWSGTKYAYEIEFGNDRDAVLALTGVDDEVQASNVTQFVTPAGDAYGIAPAYREPSAPTAVLLSSVSRSNLGVSWSAPDLTGGSEVLKYLVEWDSDRDFSTLRDMDSSFGSVAAATAGAVVVNATKSEAESRRSEFQYQITGLVMGRSYWVRVSAYNDYMGYGDAASSEPASAAPADQLLGAPSKFRANLSDTEMPDRLLLTFQQPVLDGNGFDIGTGADYTPNKATAYRIEWSASSSFPAAETSYYDWRARGRRPGPRVQSVRVFSDSDSPLTNGSYKLIYAGPSSPTTRLIVTPGSRAVRQRLKDVDSATVANAADVIRTGDFVRLGGVDGKLYYAFVVTPPETCIPYDATPAEMLDHLREQMDDLPFEETLVVSRDSNTSVDSGYRYRVTFSGGAFSAQPVAELEVVSRLTAATHGLADICANFTKAQSSTASRRTSTRRAGARGAYYLRLAAVNDVGVGSYAAPSIDGKHDTLGAIAPSAPPGLPTNVKVFAEKESATSLLVTWETVDDDHGAEITGWRVEYANASYSETYDNDWHKGFFFKEADADARSFLLDNLTAGTTYAVGVRAVNARAAPPAWYEYTRPSLPWWYEQTDLFDVKEGRQRAVATCPPTGLTETGPRASGPDGFTATSVVTSWKNGGNRGDEVDKFLVEWSMDDQFAGDSYQSKIVQNNRTSEPNVEQVLNLTCADDDCRGDIVFVRISAHNSLGFSNVSETMEAVPMKSSDAPRRRSALDEDAGEYTVQDVGSQLLVKWTVPVNDSVDIYGNGGDTITSYLVEYSKEPWDDFVPVIQRLQVASNAPGGVLGGTIRLSLNTTDDSNAAVKSFATSSQIFVGNATAYDVKIALENMENVGEVEVTGTVSGSGDSHTYDITFVDVVGNMSLLQPYAEGVRRQRHLLRPDLFNITELRNATVPYGAEYRQVVVDVDAGDGMDFEYFWAARTAGATAAAAGVTYYCRVAAGHTLGYGARRQTRPPYVTVPRQTPGTPGALAPGGADGIPTLEASSDQTLVVQIARPMARADCVKGFDVDTHVFNYTGKNDDPASSRAARPST